MYKIPYLYTDKSAPYFIISNGMLGEYLSMDESEGSLFISRDAGWSWEMIRSGTYIYEVSNGGSLIVIGRSMGLTDELEVSFDFGVCWTSVKLPIEMHIHNIVIEPTLSSHLFLVHGMDDDGLARLFTLDTKKLAPNIGACEPQDYEYFTQPECVLGLKLSMQRKRLTSVCFGELGQAKTASGCKPGISGTVGNDCKCACNRVKDLQCDYGFVPEKLSNDFACVEIGSEGRNSFPGSLIGPLTSTSPGVCPILKSRDYVISTSGYRLNPGDQCVSPSLAGIYDTDGRGRSLIDPVQPNKNHHPRGGGSSSLIASFGHFLFVLLFVSILIIGCAFCWTKLLNEEQRSRCMSSIPLDMDAIKRGVANGCEWVKEKLPMYNTSLRRQRQEENFELLAGDEFGLEGEDEQSASPLI